MNDLRATLLAVCGAKHEATLISRRSVRAWQALTAVIDMHERNSVENTCRRDGDLWPCAELRIIARELKVIQRKDDRV